MKVFKYIQGLFRITFGFCPACNSDAPEIYHCTTCKSNTLPKKYWWKSFLTTLQIALFTVTLHAADPIPITKIETLNGLDNAALSFDGNTSTSWFQGWSVESARAVITFDGTYDVTKIKYFDGTGQPTLNIYATGASTPTRSILLHQYWVWAEQSIQITGKSLTIEISGLQGDRAIPEIIFYGKKTGDSAPDPITPSPSFRDTHLATSKISVCGFHWTPLDKMKIFAFKRDFQPAWWTWSKWGFSPDPLFGGASTSVQGYDKYFQDAKDAGIEILPCINETPDHFWGGEYNLHPKTLPCPEGEDRTDPDSYLEYSRYLFQYAARYGRQKWDNQYLEVNPNPLYNNSPINQKKSGLATLKYMEPWNEPDAWWLDTTIYANPEQFAAFLSAAYDGHCGTLGKAGIKSADTSMLVVMPGLTGADLKYLKRVVDWSRKNRPDWTLPWDICNFHHYNNQTNQAGRWPPTWTEGIPADMDPAWPDVIAYVNYCHGLGRQVWWTEMGYDSKSPSWQYAKPYGPYTSDSLQAMWLVRNYLTGIAAGIDNIFTFNAINEPGAPNGGLYQNSGVLYGQGDVAPFTPKPAWHAIRTLVSVLDGYKYHSDISVGSTVKILAFSKKGKSLIAYWSPTAEDKKVSFRYQGKSLVAEETVKYVEYDWEVKFKSKNNLFTRVFNPASIASVRK